MHQLFTALFFCLFLSSAVAQSTVYVTPTGSGNQSGGSWSDATSATQLQSRLASATAGTQFWIAGGKYSPGVLRTATFQIPSGVQVYGGFIGNESQLAQRQLSSPSSTTFTGETGDPAIIGDNNRHVVSFRNVSTNTRLDGLVITGGNADSGSSPDNLGGGVYNEASASNTSAPQLTNCVFVANSAANGGGMCNTAKEYGYCLPTITACIFTRNKATSSGGGVYNDTSRGVCSPTFSACQFTVNEAQTGGGLTATCSFSSEANKPIFLNCIFNANSARSGGGISFSGGFNAILNPTFTNCLFANNQALNTGGAINTTVVSYSNATLTLTNCTVNANGASSGSGIFSNRYDDSALTIRFANSIIRNGGFAYDGTTNKVPPTYNVTYSDVEGGFNGTGNIDANPLFVDIGANDYRLRNSSPAINTGDPASTTATISATDIGGHNRIVDNRIDMGASEWPAITIKFVTTSGSGDQSGTSWNNALPGVQLQSRLASASAGTQFWIAGGTYKPTTGIDRTISFFIPSGVQLYGGFAGVEQSISERKLADPSSTVLSGEIGNVSQTSDNSYHVLTIRDATLGETTLNGFVITSGNANNNNTADGTGGGLLHTANSIGVPSNPLLTKCLFVANLAGRGGAIASVASLWGTANLRLVECYFKENIANEAGALYFSSGQGTLNPQLTSCSFDDNTAIANNGGAIVCQTINSNSNSNVVANLSLTNCSFRRNKGTYGGAVALLGFSGGTVNSIFTNCVFSSNTATQGGGSISNNGHYSGVSSPRFDNCLFTQNTASRGAAIYNAGNNGTCQPEFKNCTIAYNFLALPSNNVDNGSGALFNTTTSGICTTSFTNCVLWRNSSEYASNQTGIVNEEGATTTINYSNIQGGFSGTGNINADPLFVDAPNGDLRLKAGSPSINTGDPNSTTVTVSATDLAGNQRVAENRIDMGAYEFQVSAVTGSDLSLTVHVDTRTPAVGQLISCYVRITNDGPLTATNATWQHRLPTNLEYVPGSNLSVVNGVITGDFAPLSPGMSSTMSYQLRATQPGLYINAVQITAADQPDPDSQPNSGTGDGQDDAAQVDVRVGGASSPVYASANPNQVPLPPVQSNQPTPDPSKVDLALSISVDNRVPKVGDLLTYVLTVTNQGGATASNVRVTTYLPDGQQFEASGDGLSVSDGGVSGGTASIPAGGQVSIRFTARVTSAKMGVTKAQIRQASPADTDSTPDNGTDNGEDDTAQIDLRSQTGL